MATSNPSRPVEHETRRRGHDSGSGAAFLLASAGVLVLSFSGGAFDPVTYGQAGVVLWAAIALSFALGWLPATSPGPGTRRILWAFLAFVGWSALSLVWTESVERTVQDVERLALLGGMLVLVAFGVHRGNWRSAASGLAAGAMVVCLVAVASRISPTLFADAATNSAFGGGRLAFPITYWNALAGVAAFAMCSGVAFGTWAERREVRGFALAAVPVAMLALHLTYSRGGVVAAVAGLAMLVALAGEHWRKLVRPGAFGLIAGGVAIAAAESQPEIADGTGGDGGLIVLAALALGCALCGWAGSSRAGRRERRGRALDGKRRARSRPPGRSVAVVAAAAAIGLTAVAWISDDSSSLARPEAAGESNDLSSRLASFDTSRSGLWSAAIDGGAAHPLGGTGAGTFEIQASGDADVTEPADDAHSILLEALAELGVPGLALIAAFIAFAGRLVWRSTHAVGHRERAAESALTAGFVIVIAQAMVDWTWEVGTLAAIGLGGALMLGARDHSARRRRSATRVRNLAFAGSAILAVALVPALVSAERVSSSERALAAGLQGRALSLAEDSVTAAPWSASAQDQLARVHLAARDLDEARQASERARELEPDYWAHTALAAQIEATAGDLDEARDLLLLVGRQRPAIADLAAQLATDPSVVAAPEMPPAP